MKLDSASCSIARAASRTCSSATTLSTSARGIGAGCPSMATSASRTGSGSHTPSGSDEARSRSRMRARAGAPKRATSRATRDGSAAASTAASSRCDVDEFAHAALADEGESSVEKARQRKIVHAPTIPSTTVLRTWFGESMCPPCILDSRARGAEPSYAAGRRRDVMELGFETIGNATLICHDRGRCSSPIHGSRAAPTSAAGSSRTASCPSRSSRRRRDARYVWFSHGHPDHLNGESLPLMRDAEDPACRTTSGRRIREGSARSRASR